jgi:hypothetical protein
MEESMGPSQRVCGLYRQLCEDTMFPEECSTSRGHAQREIGKRMSLELAALVVRSLQRTLIWECRHFRCDPPKTRLIKRQLGWETILSYLKSLPEKSPEKPPSTSHSGDFGKHFVDFAWVWRIILLCSGFSRRIWSQCMESRIRYVL